MAKLCLSVASVSSLKSGYTATGTHTDRQSVETWRQQCGFLCGNSALQNALCVFPLPGNLRYQAFAVRIPKILVMAGFEPARSPNSALSCRLNHSATSPHGLEVHAPCHFFTYMLVVYFLNAVVLQIVLLYGSIYTLFMWYGPTINTHNASLTFYVRFLCAFCAPRRICTSNNSSYARSGKLHSPSFIFQKSCLLL